jgi:hypothetical protein
MVLLGVVYSKSRFWRSKSLEKPDHIEKPHIEPSSNGKDEHKPKAKLEMNQSIIAREHQGVRDEVLATMMNKTLLTSAAYAETTNGSNSEVDKSMDR